MIKYEYNAINNPQFLGDRLLNKLGEDGWELVSHAYNSNTCDHFYTFKREKSALPKGIASTQTYDGVKAKTFVRDESDDLGPAWKNMFWENPILYARLENMIMEWSNDETKTAGELTRSILKLIK